jgi:hypothetical protein
MKITHHLLFSIALCSLVSCNSDESKKQSLNGHWELKYAELNGQPAPSLDRIHFDFNNGNLTTNFNEATTDETTSFDVKKEILVKNSQPKVEFNIQTQTDSSLEMTTEMRGFDFKLVLARK